MALTSEDVARLAALARIELTDAELAHLAPQIDVIVDAVAGVAEVKDLDVPPMSLPAGVKNVMRTDKLVTSDHLRPLLEAQAPAWQDDRFLVPRILQEIA